MSMGGGESAECKISVSLKCSNIPCTVSNKKIRCFGTGTRLTHASSRPHGTSKPKGCSLHHVSERPFWWCVLSSYDVSAKNTTPMFSVSSIEELQVYSTDPEYPMLLPNLMMGVLQVAAVRTLLVLLLSLSRGSSPSVQHLHNRSQEASSMLQPLAWVISVGDDNLIICSFHC
jgi:hypothetical protein